jgi:hypothetical protein
MSSAKRENVTEWDLHDLCWSKKNSIVFIWSRQEKAWLDKIWHCAIATIIFKCVGTDTPTTCYYLTNFDPPAPFSMFGLSQWFGDTLRRRGFLFCRQARDILFYTSRGIKEGKLFVKKGIYRDERREAGHVCLLGPRLEKWNIEKGCRWGCRWGPSQVG